MDSIIQLDHGSFPYDDYFETPKLEGNIDVHWKRLAHLRENEETELFDDEFDTVHGKPLKEYEPAPSLYQSAIRDDYGLWQGRSRELSWMEKACSVTVCQNIFIVNLANGPSSPNSPYFVT